LIAVAQRLSSHIQNCDTVASFGGDEFVVLFSNVLNNEDALQRATIVFNILKEPFFIKQRECFISASGGLVVSDTSRDAHSLLRDADAAMHQAKSKGRSQLQVFDLKLQQKLIDRVSLANDLRNAETRDELILNYQPVYDIDAMTLLGVEALVRWRHPIRGLVSPADFIPIAEGTGLIIPIGIWVLNEAVRQMRVWLDNHKNIINTFSVAVNVSMTQLSMPNLVNVVAETLQRHNVESKHLTIELTESALMSEVDGGMAVLRQLNELGCQISIDDFGTGYSSMAYLRDLPVHTLKIDRAFVTDLLRSQKDIRVVAAMVNIARELGMNTVAEGVENNEQILILREVRCDKLQGFHLMRPVDSSAIDSLIKLQDKTKMS